MCRRLLDEAGMCFFFAQQYHTSMKYVGAIRKELGFRTVFNILGPLTNPGKPTMQLLGVYDEYLVQPLAQVLMNLGVRRGQIPDPQGLRGRPHPAGRDPLAAEGRLLRRRRPQHGG